jgi:hypothetical protein
VTCLPVDCRNQNNVTCLPVDCCFWWATHLIIQCSMASCTNQTSSSYDQRISCSPHNIVRDSSAVWRLLWTCCSRGTSESYAYGKQQICFSNSWSAHFHVSWLSDFIFYQIPLYKSLHQSFFYSFITILPSESGVTLHYSTILP